MDVEGRGRQRRERRRDHPEHSDQRPADEHVAEQTVELADFVLVEYRPLVGDDRTWVPETVANRPRIASVVPGDQEVVEVDTDADDGSEGDPADSGQQVQPGVQAGGQADGDREQEVVSRVDRNPSTKCSRRRYLSGAFDDRQWRCRRDSAVPLAGRPW